MSSDIELLVTRFRMMSDTQRREVLLSYLHELTILARAYFADSEFDRARLCNETVHRVTGFMLGPLMGDDFLETLAVGAREKGWFASFQRAFMQS